MNKLELIKKDLEEGADYNFDHWNKGDLQMLEEIVIATENVVKKLNIPVVNQQRELLLAFLLWRDETWGLREDVEGNKEQIEEYLKANNCG